MESKTYLRPLLYSALLCIGLIVGFLIPHTSTNKFKEVLDIVGKDYVDSVGNDLENQMVSKYLSSLDPHSIYIPAKYYKYAQESLQGNYVGIGIEFDLIDSSIYVNRVIANSPAEKAGLKAGDRILRANATSFEGITEYSAVIDALKGPVDEVLVLLIKHRDDRVETLNINRSTVPNSSVKAAFVLGSVGYINFSRFSSNSHSEFKEALLRLKKTGFKTLVIDLRGNGGGFLREAEAIANEFLQDGQLIAYIQGRNRKKQEFVANGKGIYKKGKLVLLTNRKSASASEILAGALQDHDRATIIGTSSYGKGLVQESYYFKDSSTLKLTVARYYLPTGRSIQKNYQSLQDSLNSDTFYTLVKRRKMVDGNGIHPDKLYPKEDTSALSDLVWQISYSDLTEKFILEKYNYIEVTSPKEFVSKFSIPNAEVIQLLKRIEKDKDLKFPLNNKVFMSKVLKMLRNKVAYSYYGLDYYYYSKVLSEDWRNLL